MTKKDNLRGRGVWFALGDGMTDPRVLQELADLEADMRAYVFWDRWKASIWLERLAAIRKAEDVTHDQEIAGLKLQVKALQKALRTLLAWLPQSANSRIRVDEASRLINIMNGHE